MHRAILMQLKSIFGRNHNTIFHIDPQILEVVRNIGNSMFACKVFDIWAFDPPVDRVLDAFPGEELDLDILWASSKLVGTSRYKYRLL
jgi:hypothetical protein